MSDANGNVLSEDYLRGLSEGCTGEERYRLCDAADEMTRLRSDLASALNEIASLSLEICVHQRNTESVQRDLASARAQVELTEAERGLVDASLKMAQGWLDGHPDAHERVQFAIAASRLLALRVGEKAG